jgi:hypothetical protein
VGGPGRLRRAGLRLAADGEDLLVAGQFTTVGGTPANGSPGWTRARAPGTGWGRPGRAWCRRVRRRDGARRADGGAVGGRLLHLRRLVPSCNLARWGGAARLSPRSAPGPTRSTPRAGADRPLVGLRPPATPAARRRRHAAARRRCRCGSAARRSSGCRAAAAPPASTPSGSTTGSSPRSTAARPGPSTGWSCGRSTDLPPGVHTVRVEHTRLARAGATDDTVVLDAFVVR